jgi:hypothetical protein
MPPNELLQMLRTRPFIPFRIHVSDGTIYEVRHPELVVLSLASAVVAFPDPAHPGLASRWEVIARRPERSSCLQPAARPMYVVRLEPIAEPASQAG